MEKQNQNLSESLKIFQKQYPSITSADLQTFILGYNACEKDVLNSDKKYVIKNLDNNRFVSIDNQNGGYPRYVEIHNAKIFDSYSLAERYKTLFPMENWEIVELYFYLKN